jgi:hypothetical protein
LKIFRVVQTLLVIQLLFMAFYFNQLFVLRGKPEQLIFCILAALVIQLIVLYPIFRLAKRDSQIEFDSAAAGLPPETLAALRKKRLMSDLWKVAGVVFYITFVAIAPDVKRASGAPLVLATAIFSFLLTCLAYFQCYNYNAKKLLY